ncbi:carboxypeptidase B [Lepeophtheirus salmonis]|nr:carboxypeptidase B-like [Lepeophtheirus salmonis]
MRFYSKIILLLCVLGEGESWSLYRLQVPSDKNMDNDVLSATKVLQSRNCTILKVVKETLCIDFICSSSETFENEFNGTVSSLQSDLSSIVEVAKSFYNSSTELINDSALLDFESFPSYEELEKYLLHLKKTYPQLIELKVVGKTHENRSLYFLKIGQIYERIEKKAVFIDGGIHAREWGSVSSVAYIISRLVELFNDPTQRLLDARAKVNWYIMPLVNPDGYEFTRTTNRLWRKNRAPPPSGSGCYGVDLNRNWNVSGYGVGASDNPCSEIYKGPYPDSEPEVKAAKELLSTLKDIHFYLGFHSYGSYILTPFGYTTDLPKDNERITRVGHSMRKAIYNLHGRNYSVGSPANIFYVAGGASDDYSKLSGIPTSMTIELPEVNGGGFVLPPNKIKEIGKEAWASILPVSIHVVEHEDQEVKDSFYVIKKDLL